MEAKKRLANKPLPVVLFLAAFVLTFEFSLAATAGTLTIKTHTAMKTEGDRLLGTIKVCNRGDVDAHNVRANISVLGERIKSPVKKLLAAGESETFRVEKTLSGIKKGRYPVTVIIDFNDANQYPFSAVSCTTFSFQEDVKADLLCVVEDLTIQKKGQLRLNIKNPGLGSRNIRAMLVLPKEFSSPRSRIDFDIQAGSEKTVVFEIENLSALSGATYPVFCSLEYDLPDTHYTAVSSAMVRISQRQNWFQRTKWLWAAAGILLGATFILYQLRRSH